MTTTWTLVHLVWLLGQPMDAPPTRITTGGMPSRQWCEQVRILAMSEWEPKARRHLAPAFHAMAEAIQKAAPPMGHVAFVAADISKMIDYALEDVIDNMDPAFLSACKGEE